jgi:predicted metal-binding protein
VSGRRVAAYAATLAIGLGAWGVVPALSDDRSHDRDNVDLLASANPAEEGAAVTDEAFDTRARTAARYAKADASAVATATCVGCTGDAVALQVVRMNHPREAAADNVATAWSTCDNCSSTALSVQVVLLKRAGEVRANNRAAAVNAGCADCTADSLAVQLVVQTTTSKPMSKSAVAELEQWVEEQAEQLRAASATIGLRASTRGRGADDLLDDLDQLVTSHVPGRVVDRNVDSSAG